MKLHILSASLLLAAAATARAAGTFTVDFEDKTIPASGFVNGGPTTNSAGFSDGTVHFGNDYSSDFGGFWSGFSLSNVVNTTTAGFGNQYASYAGGGAGGSANYAVYFDSFDSFIDLPVGDKPVSVQLTNTTYAALSMKNGDSFTKKFGGPTGNDPDFFSVTLTGFAGASGGGVTTGSTTFYLADYRSTDNALDHIVNTWTTVDLTPLGNAQSIGLSFASSDVGQFGINTPTYFALDNLVVIPEPTYLTLAAIPFALLKRTRR